MEKWKKIKLSEVLKEKTERNKNNETDLVLSVTNSKGFVKQSDFFEGTVHSEDISNYKLVRKNEFAYNPSRINVGSIDILKDYDIGALSPMYVIFSVDETRLLPDYFKYYFQTHKFNENVKNNTQGSVRNSLSFKALSEFEYLLPPIEEQKRMVKILDQVNKVIEKYQNLINEKEQFIKSQFVEMLNKIKNIEYRKIDELVLFQNGINASAEKYGKGTKCISVMDILNNSYIDYELIRGSVEVTEEQAKNYNVSYGDILFVRSSENLKDAGKSNVYVDRKMDSVFGGFVIRGKKNAEYNPYYINMALKENCVRKQMMKYAAGTQHINIGQESLKKVMVPMCNLNIQNAFENLYKLIDKQKFHSVFKNILKIKESEGYA